MHFLADKNLEFHIKIVPKDELWDFLNKPTWVSEMIEKPSSMRKIPLNKKVKLVLSIDMIVQLIVFIYRLFYGGLHLFKGANHICRPLQKKKICRRLQHRHLNDDCYSLNWASSPIYQIIAGPTTIVELVKL